MAESDSRGGDVSGLRQDPISVELKDIFDSSHPPQKAGAAVASLCVEQSLLG